jgi:hypothetical protein
MNEKVVVVLASISLIGGLALGGGRTLAVPLEKQSTVVCRARTPYVGQTANRITGADVQALRALERMLYY